MRAESKPAARTQATRLVAIILWAFAVPVAAQVTARSGPVVHNTAHEQLLLDQVKAPAGFTTKLFAAPPYAMYPTCLTATVQGVVFVCVDPNLSLSADKGRGRIVRLVDDNGDGSADRYSIFAEMDSPRGLAYDGKTLYVMHPPTLTAYRDTTGDGIADVSEDLVTGLGFGLEFRGADHGTNGITLGIDGWIYIAVGDYGYMKAIGKDGASISHHGGSVVRVRTDGTGLEIYATGTRNIYDLGVDPFLHVFTRDNTNDGDGWDTRLHYIPAGANMGYPMLYLNFPTEHMPSLADYGGGAGTGGLWVHDPGFPEGFGNTLYTGDWTVNKVLRHPLQAKGASYTIGQQTFLDIPHPADMAMDGQSNMFVASLAGGSFNYIGDSVGYVVRVSPVGITSKRVDPALLSDGALRGALLGPNAAIRLQAQREILRRGAKSAVISALQIATLDRKRPSYARVAAMFTLRQLTNEKSQATLIKAVADSAIRGLAIRALVDDKGSAAKVPITIFLRALADTSPAVQLQAIAALVRQSAFTAAPAIAQLAGSADPAVAHIAINALVSLHAVDAALAAVATGSPAVRIGALRALQQMHDPVVVAKLVAMPAEPDVVLALARLYHHEAPWAGDWWGTQPFFAGPYFAGVTWEGSASIAPALRSALTTQSNAALLDGFVKNRVIPQGSAPLFAALATAPGALRTEVIEALTGTDTVDATMVPLLTRLDTSGASLHVAVATLLANEKTVTTAALPLARAAALDGSLDSVTRGKLVTGISGMSGRGAFDNVVAILALVNPPIIAGASPSTNDVEIAWRRYVGDRRRQQELDNFIGLTRSGTPAERTLAFAVLIQNVRSARTAADIAAKVRPALDAAWNDALLAPRLADAITIMRLESQYTEKLAAWRNRPAPKPVQYDWVQLFDGKDLKGWDMKFANHPLNENFNNTFRVEDGLLKVRYDQWSTFAGEFGHLFTKDAYSYYIVAAEYRFVGEQVTGAGAGNSWAIRNNGMMIHSQSAASMGFKQDFPISLEVQILGGLGKGKRPNGNLCTPGTDIEMNGKRVTTHCINSTSQTYDGDQWVRLEALVLGDSIIKHIVNGDTVLTYSKPQMGGGMANNTNPGVLIEGKPLKEGHIALQAETAPIDFRKVEIVNLMGCMDPKAANYKVYYVKSDPKACKQK